MPTTLLGEQVHDGPAGCGVKASLLFTLSLFAMVVAALERTSERKRLLMWSLDRAAYKGDIWRMVQVLMRVCNEHACPKLGESILISMPLFQLLENILPVLPLIHFSYSLS